MNPLRRLHLAVLLLPLAAACTETGLEPAVPETIPTPEYVALSVGAEHACALDVEGRAFCWGRNSWGQLGDGSGTHREAPMPVGGDHRFRLIDAGAFRTCGITVEDRLLCWGSVSGSERLLPVPYGPESLTWDTVSDGHWGTCAIDSAGRAFCDVLGLPSFSEVPLERTWSSISVGTSHVCGVTTESVGYCWGFNSYRQLGFDDWNADYTQLYPAPGDHRWRELVAGNEYTCGVTEADEVLCWGKPASLALGQEVTDEDDLWRGIAEPMTVPTGRMSLVGLSTAVSGWAPAKGATCGRADVGSTGTFVCWGDGQTLINIGFGRYDWTTVEVGADRACGLTADRNILCWEGLWRQTGSGSFEDRVFSFFHEAIAPVEIPAPPADWRTS